MKSFAVILVIAMLGLLASAVPQVVRSSGSPLPMVFGNGTHFYNMTAGRGSNIPSASSGHSPSTNAPDSANIDCGNIPGHISGDDCNYLSSIGVSGLGWGTSDIWLGNNGADVFHFHNNANQPIIMVMWTGEGFISANAPALTVSMGAGQTVDVSLNDNGQYGGFAAVYNHNNVLNNAGQLWQTWGEWSTGQYRTFDISREVDMIGAWLQITGNNGCNAEWADNFSQCCFTCSHIETPAYSSCWTYGNYWLDNCYSGNPGAGSSQDLSSGGCTGWTSADVYFI